MILKNDDFPIHYMYIVTFVNMIYCISKVCLEIYIFIIINVNMVERPSTKIYENASVNRRRNLRLHVLGIGDLKASAHSFKRLLHGF